MNLQDKLFWDIVHYKVHIPTGIECTISTTTGVPRNACKKLKLKAQRNGYRYNRRTHHYTCVKGNVEYHLIFA